MVTATAASFIMKETLHRPAAEYGFWFLTFPAGYFFGNFVSSRVGSRARIETMVLIGSILYSLPFAVQPIQHAFEAIGARPMEVAATLGASPMNAFFTVALPLAKPGILTAAILSFAHTVGEFGVVLMIGGNIPGKTSVLSTQIYGHVEALEYAQAHWLAGAMLLFSFIVLLALALLGRRRARVLP
jgi:molybdate transport system permease protein